MYAGTSLVVQWLRLCILEQEDLGLIFGQGTRYHTVQLKILHATTKTRGNQKKKAAKPGYIDEDT